MLKIYEILKNGRIVEKSTLIWSKLTYSFNTGYFSVNMVFSSPYLFMLWYSLTNLAVWEVRFKWNTNTSITPIKPPYPSTPNSSYLQIWSLNFFVLFICDSFCNPVFAENRSIISNMISLANCLSSFGIESSMRRLILSRGKGIGFGGCFSEGLLGWRNIADGGIKSKDLRYGNGQVWGCRGVRGA